MLSDLYIYFDNIPAESAIPELRMELGAGEDANGNYNSYTVQTDTNEIRWYPTDDRTPLTDGGVTAYTQPYLDHLHGEYAIAQLYHPGIDGMLRPPR